MAESDLYRPVRDWFSAQGYTVRGEVLGCDLAAEKDGLLAVAELKLSFGLPLVYQALDRLQAAGAVYMVIPRPPKAQGTAYRRMVGLARRLGLGLLTVALDSPSRVVDALALPPDAGQGGADAAAAAAARGVRRGARGRRRAEAIRREMAGRTMDANLGGRSRTPVNTAYRERCVRLACALEARGPASAKTLVREMGCAKDAWSMLAANAYGWFDRTGKGVFCLSAAGHQALAQADRAAAAADPAHIAPGGAAPALVRLYRGMYGTAGN